MAAAGQHVAHHDLRGGDRLVAAGTAGVSCCAKSLAVNRSGNFATAIVILLDCPGAGLNPAYQGNAGSKLRAERDMPAPYNRSHVARKLAVVYQIDRAVGRGFPYGNVVC